MNCPICDIPLKMTDRQGIEIDYCPRCRGVWLDRGELDKIIDRTLGTMQADATIADYDDSYPHGKHKRDMYPHEQRPNSTKHKKRKSFLGDLFDFDLFD